MGQQYYIKTEQCESIHELGNIRSAEFNEFVRTAIDEKINKETQ